MTMSCEPSALFRQQEYTLPQVPEFLKVQTQHHLSHRQVLDPDFWRFIHFSLHADIGDVAAVVADEGDRHLLPLLRPHLLPLPLRLHHRTLWRLLCLRLQESI